MNIQAITGVVLADSSAAMGWLFVVGFVVVYLAYVAFLHSGMRPRTVVTSLSEEQITDVFLAKVAGMGWHVTDWYSEDPTGRLVAESSLLAGIRQQIGLRIAVDPRHPGMNVARVTVLRYSKKVFGGPTKAHTLRMRLTAFSSGIRRLDPGALVTIGADAPVSRPASASPMGMTPVPVPVPTHTITPVGVPAAVPAGVGTSVRGSALARAGAAGRSGVPDPTAYPGRHGSAFVGTSGPSCSVGLKGSLATGRCGR